MKTPGSLVCLALLAAGLPGGCAGYTNAMNKVTKRLDIAADVTNTKSVAICSIQASLDGSDVLSNRDPIGPGETRSVGFPHSETDLSDESTYTTYDVAFIDCNGSQIGTASFTPGKDKTLVI